MYVKLQARLKGQRMYERSLTVKAAFPQLGEVGGWWEKEIHDSFASNTTYSLRSHEIQSTYKLSKMIYENRQQVQNDRTMYRSLSSLHTLKSEQNSHALKNGIRSWCLTINPSHQCCPLVLELPSIPREQRAEISEKEKLRSLRALCHTVVLNWRNLDKRLMTFLKFCL